ncbi:deoxyribodipyrimidine photo-lyase [Candidatus Palibaumannia cicadellinicola]|uniref:Deoxyribodipyrimidine photo-lyase n=1 Tax=Candidatus Palibaumannia cicadellinicola TaxID=186490 RepID=A0A2N4XX64_9GAMM|nr:deoxyribodipyrimidine photo-lyase [Candidatus Baumannia cicadellinicola]PLK58929.1 deoxyribodipyrimidine photo-lyase [Candidatus Baumannia cicadellinicola]
MKTSLVWFRKDLRIHDNKALHAACEDPSARVLTVFIATPKQWYKHNMSQRQAAFIFDHLEKLAQELSGRGIALYYHQCANFAEQIDWLLTFCQREKVNQLFYNYEYELNERKRDQELERRISNQILCQGFDDSVLLPPGNVLTKNQEMFQVYTSFRNVFLHKLQESKLVCLPAPAARQGHGVPSSSIIVPFTYPRMRPENSYLVGERAGMSQLRTFCHHNIQYYLRNRDIPALNATSRLSAWLAIGVLSPRQCYQQLRERYPLVLTQNHSPAFIWLNQLIWRDFYRHMIVAYPKLCKHEPFISWTKHITWQNNDLLFRAWCEGRTGYPIIDAAMRKLAVSGWINNRLRMITASFLVKDLLIDWRQGERYFMSQLIDGDLASNNGGWQWVASTGFDAAPYFRIFNPTIQGKQFDQNGTFIRRWLPELKVVPDKYLHQPYRWLKVQNIRLNYPQPIVDHSNAYKQTLTVYKAAAKIAKAKGTRQLEVE